MTLLSCRFRWYAYETGRLLRRHWKALFLVLMLLSPVMMPVFEQVGLLGAPVLAMLAPAHGAPWRFAGLMLLEACGVLWLLIQRHAVSGGAFMDYFRSLPCRPAQLRRTNLAVLMLANTPLLLPVLAATAVLAAQASCGTHLLFVLDLVLTTLGAQLLVLERTWRRGPWVLMANLLMAVSIGTHPASAQFILSLCALAGFIAIAAPPATAATTRRFARSRTTSSAAGTPSTWHSRLISRRFPLLHVSARILFDRYRSTSLVRGAALASLVVGAVLLMQIWHFDSRALPLALLTQSLLALAAAGAYRDLLREHERAAPYRLALPITHWAWALADCAIVILTWLPFALAVTGAVAVHRDSAGALTGLFSVLLMVPLPALLRSAQVLTPRQSLVSAGLLCGAWTWLVWWILL